MENLTWTLTSLQLITSTIPTTSSNTRPNFLQLSAGTRTEGVTLHQISTVTDYSSSDHETIDQFLSNQQAVTENQMSSYGVILGLTYRH